MEENAPGGEGGYPRDAPDDSTAPRPRDGSADPDPTAGDPLGDLAGEDEFYEFPDEFGEDADPHTALPTKVEAWRRRSATGAILTGFALGLQQVFEPKRDEPAVIMETSGEPPKDLPVEADFEYGRPKQSVVNVRPWLLPGARDDTDGVDEPADADADRDAGRDNGDRDA